MPKDKFYITTTLPYVNADPHIGFALEITQADIIARYHKEILGEEVVFNTGTDEHGQKIYQKALEAGKELQAYVNENAAKFDRLKAALNLSYTNFIRTTDPRHIAAAGEFWKRCEKNGDIYKKNYKIKYCVGCELEKAEGELERNKCPIHPNLELEIRKEENYFFKFSKYQEPLIKLYNQNPDFVVPNFRFNEIKRFVNWGLRDFSVSRLREKMPWGIPVPGDEDHVMYVWFDALINYISTLGWPEDKSKIKNKKSKFEEYWGTKEYPNAIQIAGKDNLRQQSAMWQAMLMSAGLPNSKQIIIHGFINSGGQKMSKSLGNVADPYKILNGLQAKGLSGDQATDALRYYLAREISPFEDSDYSWKRLVGSYNAGLANGLGNLTSRILKMASLFSLSLDGRRQGEGESNKINKYIEKYELQKAVDEIWKKIKSCDEYIQKTQPFKAIKTDAEKAKKDIEYLLSELHQVAVSLRPFLPYTSERILKVLKEPTLENIPKLFPRIE
ncbi:MAG: methionine--tRNA ligase [Candidatus Doudnabacteria bacterium]|nr:methionine--tRNA ligase [Candidatus Doudnabacteria bacterium]